MIIEEFVRLPTKVMSSSDNKYIATRWTPKLEMNTNKKISKRLRKLRDGWTYYTAIQGILIHGLQLHVMHTIMGRVV